MLCCDRDNDPNHKKLSNSTMIQKLLQYKKWQLIEYYVRTLHTFYQTFYLFHTLTLSDLEQTFKVTKTPRESLLLTSFVCTEVNML